MLFKLQDGSVINLTQALSVTASGTNAFNVNKLDGTHVQYADAGLVVFATIQAAAQ